MNPCTHFRGQLEDVALGGAATPEFSRHLAECAACAAELERQSALARRLDVAIRAVVRAEPPSQLSAGVAARLAAARRPGTRSPLRIWSAALAAVAACAVIAILGSHALERPPTAPSELSALSAWRSPTASLLEPLDALPQPHTLPHPSPGATHDS
jgi:anti-sigma factor RsiW